MLDYTSHNNEETVRSLEGPWGGGASWGDFTPRDVLFLFAAAVKLEAGNLQTQWCWEWNVKADTKMCGFTLFGRKIREIFGREKQEKITVTGILGCLGCLLISTFMEQD